jgi:hypothetical protein
MHGAEELALRLGIDAIRQLSPTFSTGVKK